MALRAVCPLFVLALFPNSDALAPGDEAHECVLKEDGRLMDANEIVIEEMERHRVRVIPLKVTPAMAAGVTDRLWEVADMVRMLGVWETTYPRHASSMVGLKLSQSWFSMRITKF
jgi:hypothetical protein